MISQTISFSSKNIKNSNYATNSLVINTTIIQFMSDEDLEFYNHTQEALDRYDNSKKGLSKEDFLKELNSW